MQSSTQSPCSPHDAGSPHRRLASKEFKKANGLKGRVGSLAYDQYLRENGKGSMGETRKQHPAWRVGSFQKAASLKNRISFAKEALARQHYQVFREDN